MRRKLPFALVGHMKRACGGKPKGAAGKPARPRRRAPIETVTRAVRGPYGIARVTLPRIACLEREGER